MPIVTLLTDFGDHDYYVAAIKGVVLAAAPGTTLVDIGHQVEPGDIEGGAFLLAAAAPHFPPGTVHLAVVDPGVGSARRLLAAAAGGSFFVAPDNGLLTRVLAGAEVRAVAREALFRSAGGETFHGRDRLAPVAVWLARGEPVAQLGPIVQDPVRLELGAPERAPGRLRGKVAHIDRFGNLITDVPSAWLGEAELLLARVGDREARRRVHHYGALAPGEAGVLPGSLGTLELALRGTSLAAAWKVERGDRVEVLFR